MADRIVENWGYRVVTSKKVSLMQKSIKSAVSIVLTALSLSSLSACSALDSFRKVQDDFFHDTIGMSSGDPQDDAVRSELKDKLYGIEREKLNLILDIWRSYELSLSSHF